jgi:hypothetical protein
MIYGASSRVPKSQRVAFRLEAFGLLMFAVALECCNRPLGNGNASAASSSFGSVNGVSALAFDERALDVHHAAL